MTARSLNYYGPGHSFILLLNRNIEDYGRGVCHASMRTLERGKDELLYYVFLP
jgi:hypothetical protein